ncbi:pentalenene oxygenase [Nonomuraea solani]|uniref:Pentalenene oxygenase n=1 Tax=Nonomuraea solani TaxID=1144553 RepID=A0A1H6EPI6_9ACTN|nr:cytochrome P450 [Nonomuraea solani]SEG99757.1 pentalenene oxygenase [Nonomuraea solani]
MDIESRPTRPTPRAPGRIPLLGHTGHLLLRRLDFLDSLRRHGSVVRVELGTSSAYVVTDPQLTHTMLVTEAKAFKKGGRIIEALRQFFGNGLATVTEGDPHLRRRRLLQPMFNLAHIATRGDAMIDLVRQRTTRWHAGTPLRIHQEMRELTLAAFLTALFGTGVPAVIQREFTALLPKIMAGTLLQTILPAWLTTLPLPFNHRHRTRLTRLRTLVDETIDERRRQRQQDSGEEHPGLFDTLLDAREPETGQKLSPAHLREEVITLLTGAIETTSATLAWALYEISRNPDVEDRLYQEIDAVCGGHTLRHEQLSSLEYTRRVLQETLRCYGPAWMISRTAITTVRLGDHLISAGSEVIFSPYLLQHDPVVFPDPYRFDPDRWLPNVAHPVPRTSFLPFGDGRRKCIGESFAWTELLIILTMIASRWRLTQASRRTVRPVAHVTVNPSRLLLTPHPHLDTGHTRRER